MRLNSWISTLSLAVAAQAISWTATPFNPPSIPLAVRTPYLSAWLPQGSGVALNDGWATFWRGQIVGWAGFVKVDGAAYSFLGIPSVSGTNFTKAVQKSFKFTATQSTFVLSAGPVDLTVNFLSPVETDDLLEFSIPFSYLTVSAASTDGKTHNVQVYTDISAEWVSGDRGLTVNWNTTTKGKVLTHQVQLASPAVLSEHDDQTQYGSAYYSTPNDAGVTYQTGSDVSVRARFITNGTLANTQDTNFRAINDNWPVFAIARNLGKVGKSASHPAIFSIGHIRDPVINFITANNGRQARSAYFWSKFSTPAAVVSHFLDRYTTALHKANALDKKVNTDATKIGADYAGIVDLSIRQSIAANELTISKTASGKYNTSDIILFMKEISSDGNINTVDVIFPAWPLFLYTNPKLGKYLLEGLFRYQASGQYPNKWSVHDIGSSYPNAVGHNDGNDEAMPVEECGNMLIMALSYAEKTGDNSHLKQYGALLDQWTQFLITDSLIPANQLSTDDFAGRLENQTNLAIKGIVGIGAMSRISGILGDKKKSDQYLSIAKDYVQKWQQLAMSKTGAHLTLAYNQDETWGLAYNLFGDKLLKLNLFPQSIYEMQTKWYNTKKEALGLPLDTRHTYTKSDWEIWTAGIVTDPSLKEFLITSVKKWAADGLASQPFGDWYETTDGSPEGFRARPVVGGHLALLVL